MIHRPGGPLTGDWQPVQVPVERMPGGALETVAVPILTLDDLEAWLTQCIDDGYVNISQCIDDVRAMRVQP